MSTFHKKVKSALEYADKASDRHYRKAERLTEEVYVPRIQVKEFDEVIVDDGTPTVLVKRIYDTGRVQAGTELQLYMMLSGVYSTAITLIENAMKDDEPVQERLDKLVSLVSEFSGKDVTLVEALDKSIGLFIGLIGE